MMNLVKDLTKEPPRSPRVRINGYPYLARMVDKGRAFFAGTAGEYHFDCPLDNMLFSYKGVKGSEVEPLLKSGATDEEIAAWFDTHGTPRTREEIVKWAEGEEKQNPYHSEAKRDWFKGVCEEVGLDPEHSTLFEYLETDDRKSFAG